MEHQHPEYGNSFFRNVLESIEDYAVFTTDKDGIVSSWNSGAEHLLGFSEKEIVGLDCAVLFTDKDVRKGEPKKELRNAIRHGRALDERFHVRRDGSRFWASGKVFPLHDDEGRHIGFTKVMRNLDERRMAEERLHRTRQYAESLIESAAEPIVILNEDMTVNTANRAFNSIFRIQKKTIRNLPLAALDEIFSNPSFAELLKELHKGSGTVSNRELSLKAKDGDDRTLLINGRPLRPDEEVRLILISVQDISEKRALEQQKDDFISIASHEIRTPLTVIKSTAQLLQRGGAAEMVETFAAKINEKTDKLLTLIGYLLDVSQVHKGELIMRPEWFSIKDLARESVDEMMLIHPNLSVKLSYGIKTERIWADRFRISQVLNNLLNNAVKYSPAGKEIIVRLRENGKRGELTVSVQDFGIGIPKDEQKNLFKRFWRASTARQRNVGGIGLGLYISSQIIQKHHGRISFNSNEKGSTFRFVIPVRAAEKEI